MIASNVKFTNETKLLLNSPALDESKRRQLRKNRIKEYIRSHPAGHLLRQYQLIEAAGYDVKKKNEFQNGYNLLKRMIIDRELTEEKQAGTIRRIYTIPEDAKLVESAPEKPAPESPTPEPISFKTDTPPPLTNDQNSANRAVFALSVERKAKEFAWLKSSDSLREFIEYLKVNI